MADALNQSEPKLEQSEPSGSYQNYHFAAGEVGNEQPLVVKARSMSEAIKKAEKQSKGDK